MGRLLGCLSVLMLGVMVPIILVAAALGSIATSEPPGSSDPLIQELAGAGFQNGRLPDEALSVVSSRPGYECRVAKVGLADLAWSALVATAESDGVDVEGGWCYRTYEAQASAWLSRQCYIPTNCDGDPYPPTARPGTSLHGWGIAVDIWGATDSILGCSSPELLWLYVNAPRFGWVNPEWARCGQPGAEPWHWEYVGGGAFFFDNVQQM